MCVLIFSNRLLSVFHCAELGFHAMTFRFHRMIPRWRLLVLVFESPRLPFFPFCSRNSHRFFHFFFVMKAYLATRLIQFMRPVFFHCFFFRSCFIQFTSERVSFLKSKTSFREFLFVIFGFLRRGTHFFFGRHGARRRVGFTCGSLIFRPISTAFSTCFLFSFILMNFRAVPSVCVCVCVCFGVGVGSFLLRLRQGRPGPSFFSFFFLLHRDIHFVFHFSL